MNVKNPKKYPQKFLNLIINKPPVSMYTNNNNQDPNFAKNPSLTKLLRGKKRGGNLLEGSIHESTHGMPIDSILIVFHAFERVPSRKIELYEPTVLRARSVFQAYSRHDPVARHRMIVVER